MSDDKHPRFYVPNLTAGENILPQTESHHARSVRRLGHGDAVELFDGRGGRGTGPIIRMDRRETVVQADEIISESQHLPRVHLAMAVPKGKRLDWLLEKVTELGVASIQPVVFERSVAAGGKIDRWETHCISAAKQCNLNWLPELHEPVSLADFLAEVMAAPQKTRPNHAARGILKIVGDLTDDAVCIAEIMATPQKTRSNPVAPNQTDQTPKHVTDNSAADFENSDQKNDDVILLIGPEGGFTAAEREEIAAADFKSVKLGQTILRIETAAVALLAAVKVF